MRPAGGLVALVGATVIDGTGAAPRARCTVLIEGERIRAVGAAGLIDGVKVYMDITPEEFAPLVEEADAAGLRVMGHLGSLTAGQAIELGIDRLEHGIYAMSEFGRRFAPGELRESVVGTIE